MGRSMGELKKGYLNDESKEALSNRVSKLKELGKIIGYDIKVKDKL